MPPLDAATTVGDNPSTEGGSEPNADRLLLERALAVARRIRTGSFSINGGNYFAADSPFGGFKQSGVGREMGVPGLEEFLERKTFAVPVSGVV
jgi:acyl-CoA reductase-like NAD-dependent aldehyde dehydrogenase